MFQFWRCLTNRMTHHPVGPAMADNSLFREQSYHALASDLVMIDQLASVVDQFP